MNNLCYTDFPGAINNVVKLTDVTSFPLFDGVAISTPEGVIT